MKDFTPQRHTMVDEQLIPRGTQDARVLAAMRIVPRELFVPEKLHDLAYNDGTLPIGSNQTISQPYMVARMVELLELSGPEKVLEIGAGSGYQAAVLAACAQHVFTMDRLPELVSLARKNLERAGCSNVTVVAGDGTLGYPEHAPYDAIIVAAGAPAVPDALREQLAEGGRLVIPVGDRSLQRVLVVKKVRDTFHESYADGCVFVPLIGEHGWREG